MKLTERQQEIADVWPLAAGQLTGTLGHDPAGDAAREPAEDR